jgi:ribonucleoside-diphosphate reductase alpha chain
VEEIEDVAPIPPLTDPGSPNALNELGEKIFLDRYALKDMTKATLAVGDTVVVCVDLKTGQREIGRVKTLKDDRVTVQLRDGTILERLKENVDKPLELHPEQMMDRVARGISRIEGAKGEEWFEKFRWLLDGWKFIPGGRILAAAGSDQQLTYYNCYVIPSPKDDREGITRTLAQMMEIMSRGGGVGINIGSLRPKHAYVSGVNGRSSGSVSWGALYSFVTGLIEQGGSRRGALMLIQNCWHPDVLEFITSKREMGRITNANISVGITDEFMEAVEKDAEWDLVFPDTTDVDYDALWDGDLAKWKGFGKNVIKYKTVMAREMWNSIIESAWASAEPGVFFVERYNKMSNSWYFAPIQCTNPCGEQGLPSWGVCNLGALNLGKFVQPGQIGECEVDWETLGTAVRYAVRFLDDVIDSTPYFFEENRRQQTNERRVGLGVMGLADMLIRLGIKYGSAECEGFLDKLFGFIAHEAYLASADNAAEKGPFPKFDAEKFLHSGFMQGMPEDVREAIQEKGCRNVTLLTVAPTGTTGTMVGTSTGVEPFFFWSYMRKSRLGVHEENVAVLKEYKEQQGADAPIPDFFTTAMDMTPEEHVRAQAAVQRWVDSSISKTCNVPNDYTVEQTRELYELMYRLGCKGGTIYRDGSRDVQVLNLKDEEKKPEAAPTVAVEPQEKVRARPYKRYGVTVSQPSPSGTAHITMNDDADGRPFEVFVDIGKGGSDIKAMAEAMGRLMSLLLRISSPLSPRDRIQEIIGQIKGIGGARSLGFGKNRVRSLPDAVALALEEHYGIGTDEPEVMAAHEVEHEPVEGFVEGSGVPLSSASGNGHGKKVIADLCPTCGIASFIRKEGCHTCESCGYSEC